MAKGAAFEREHAAAIVIQAGARGMFGRIKASKRRHQLETEALRELSAIKMQSVARGHLGRKKAKAMRYALHRARMERTASVKIQKLSGLIQHKHNVLFVRWSWRAGLELKHVHQTSFLFKNFHSEGVEVFLQ